MEYKKLVSQVLFPLSSSAYFSRYESHPAFPSTFKKKDKKSNIISIIELFVNCMIESSKYIGVLEELSKFIEFNWFVWGLKFN